MKNDIALQRFERRCHGIGKLLLPSDRLVTLQPTPARWLDRALLHNEAAWQQMPANQRLIRGHQQAFQQHKAALNSIDRALFIRVSTAPRRLNEDAQRTMLEIAVEEPGVRPITIVAEEEKILDGCVRRLADRPRGFPRPSRVGAGCVLAEAPEPSAKVAGGGGEWRSCHGCHS